MDIHPLYHSRMTPALLYDGDERVTIQLVRCRLPVTGGRDTTADLDSNGFVDRATDHLRFTIYDLRFTIYDS